MSDLAANQRSILADLAHQAMLDRGFLADFGVEVLAELNAITGPASAAPDALRDLRDRPWCSIDNDDSRDLDQLTLAEWDADGGTRILVAIADVDALVPAGSAIDTHARHNTTAVYTPGRIFYMLPERLCTDLSSLDEGEDRLALVIDMQLGPDGAVTESSLYRAWVRNQARLAYNAVAAWLDDLGPAPPGMARVPGLDAQLRRQDAAAERLRRHRHAAGALGLESIEPRSVFLGEQLVDLRIEVKNRARELIEDFMIAANEATARFLDANRRASLRRVVREPKRWDRIVELARELGDTLPSTPDARALSAFLDARRAADPLRFPDLSLTVIKLLGAGEYIAIRPDDDTSGHFGLAVRHYTHSTAPNRRYTDLLTQRLVKATLASAPAPYDFETLSRLARHCTEQEDEADRVERRMRKSAAALMLAPHRGERFDAVVTGASPKGTWVRLLQPPAEGLLLDAGPVDVGDRVAVRLVSTDVARGFIDFALLAESREAGRAPAQGARTSKGSSTGR